MLLLAALVQHLKVQRSPTQQDTTSSSNNNSEIEASALARMLTENPKLMIELAVELTKSALNETTAAAETTKATSAAQHANGAFLLASRNSHLN